MIIDNSYYDELKYELSMHPDEHFRSKSKAEILADENLLNSAAYMFQKNHQDYDTDYSWAMHDAMEEVLDIYVPGHNDMVFTPEKPEKQNMNNPYEITTPFGNLTVEVKQGDYPGLCIMLKEQENGPKLNLEDMLLATVEYDHAENRLRTIVYDNGLSNEPSHIIRHKDIMKNPFLTYQDYETSELYSPDQLRVIEQAFELSLKPEEIKLIANPEFDHYRMRQVYLGFKQELSLSQIKLYAKPEYDGAQMECIRKCFRQGYSEKLIHFIANSGFDGEQMEAILYGIDHRVKFERIEKYADPAYEGNKLELLFGAMAAGLKDEQIDVIANKDFGYLKMAVVMNGFMNNLSLDEVKIYAKADFSYEQMYILKEALFEKYPKEFIHFLANPAFTKDMMNQFINAWENDVSLASIQEFSKLEGLDKMQSSQLTELRKAFEQGLSFEQVEVIANKDLNASQMRVLTEAFKEGFSINEVRLVAHSSIPSTKMKEALLELSKKSGRNLSVDERIQNANNRAEKSSDNQRNQKVKEDFVK